MAVPLSLTAAPTMVVRPSGVAYTGHGDVAGNREVRFSYEARNDPQLSFTQGGAPFVVAQRLSRVTTFLDNVAVKSYKLQYVAGDLSQVEKISECAGGDDSRCKAPTVSPGVSCNVPASVSASRGDRNAKHSGSFLDLQKQKQLDLAILRFTIHSTVTVKGTRHGNASPWAESSIVIVTVKVPACA